MLSRYGFRFEEKDENGLYYGDNPSSGGQNGSLSPFYVVRNGHLYLAEGGINQIGNWSYWWSNSTYPENHSVYYTASSTLAIYPIISSYKFQGFSL